MDGLSTHSLISSDLFPASVTFGIGLVGDYMLVGVTIWMQYYLVTKL